jgi:hypothetical protein
MKSIRYMSGSLAGPNAGGVWRCAPGPTKRADIRVNVSHLRSNKASARAAVGQLVDTSHNETCPGPQDSACAGVAHGAKPAAVFRGSIQSARGRRLTLPCARLRPPILAPQPRRSGPNCQAHTGRDPEHYSRRYVLRAVPFPARCTPVPLVRQFLGTGVPPPHNFRPEIHASKSAVSARLTLLTYGEERGVTSMVYGVRATLASGPARKPLDPSTPHHGTRGF